jgi:hypothetical protein
MGTWQIRLAIGILVGAGWVTCGPAARVAAEEAPAQAEAPKADEAVTAKVEKQINTIEDRLKPLQQEEFQASMATVKAQQVAEGADVTKYQEELAKGSMKKDHLDYRAALQSAAAQWRALAEKYDRISTMIKALDRDREKVSPSLQAKIDELAKRAGDKYRAALEKIVSCYTKCADYRNAVVAQQNIYQMTPEAKRDREMKKELAGLYKKAGDIKSSVALYQSTLEAIPEKDRMKDRKLVQEVAAAIRDAGDLRTAMQLYKTLWDSIPEKERGKDKNFDIAKALADLYDKAGDARNAAVFYKAFWDASDKKDWGTGDKLGDLCDKLGDPRTALTVYQAAYDGMNDNDKKDAKKGKKLLAKIQNLKTKLGIRPAADAPKDTAKKAGK